MNTTIPAPSESQWTAFESEVKTLLFNLIPSIEDDYRCTDDPEDNEDNEDGEPGICVTVGATIAEDGEISWSYQTGDNSFTGGAYGHPVWGVGYLYRGSNPEEIAKGIVDEIAGQTVY